MGIQATLTIVGLYEYDNTIFDLLTLPEGIDKESLVSYILTQCATLEILYPNPEVMKNLIGIWSISSQYTWNKLYETLTLEYNPLDNYDRTETRTTSSSATGNSTDSGADTTASTDSGSDSVVSTDSGSDTTNNDVTSTNKVAGFNTSTPANLATREATTTDNDTTTTYGKSNTTTDNYGKRNNTTVNYGRSNTNSFSKTDTETIRARGNIGVTSSMQLLDAQRKTVLFNLYDAIRDDFKKRFCILVY